MKKLIALLLISMLLLAGCQPTPEKPVVIQKDTEQMLEKANQASSENEGKNLREQYDIPDTYQFEAQGDNNKLKVSANAEIVVPESDKMPIINVRSGIFSQELIDKLWDVLIGDTQMWELSEQPTKANIQDMIVHYKQLIAEADTEDELKALNSGLADLEKMYTTAPETTDAVISDGQLKELVTWDPVNGKIDTRYTGIRTCSLKTLAETRNANAVYKWLSVNNPWQGEEGSIKSDVLPARIIYDTQALGNNYQMGRGTLITEDEELDETAKSFLKMTPKEAKAQVEALLQSCDIPMEVSSIEIISDGWNMEGKQETPQHYAYQIECVRAVNGLPVGGQGSTMESEASFNKPWYYEYMTIVLDDNGIIEIVWSAPLEILGAEVENSQLLPFDEIKPIFEKMVFIQYEPRTDEINQPGKFNISHVKLELMRVIKQNTDLEGLLIPVWNFYGSREYFDAEGKLIGEDKKEIIVLTINAIDGSIIDPSKGY